MDCGQCLFGGSRCLRLYVHPGITRPVWESIKICIGGRAFALIWHSACADLSLINYWYLKYRKRKLISFSEGYSILIVGNT